MTRITVVIDSPSYGVHLGMELAGGRVVAAMEGDHSDCLEALEWMVENDETNTGDSPIEELGGRTWDQVNEYWIAGLNRAIAAIAKARSTP